MKEDVKEDLKKARAWFRSLTEEQKMIIYNESKKAFEKTGIVPKSGGKSNLISINAPKLKFCRQDNAIRTPHAWLKQPAPCEIRRGNWQFYSLSTPQ